MPTISDQQLDEYQKLIKWAKREKVFKSAQDVKYLEDDVDTPIKNCVAMFALLGCQPLYSCCGFDYSGQHFHKSHQYGRPYFILVSTERTRDVLLNLSKRHSFWMAKQGGGRDNVNLELLANGNPHWRKEECIHFAEECVTGVQWMEEFLRLFESYMMDSTVLVDTNQLAKKDVEYWQYPPKKPWHIKKSDIFTRT